METQWNLIKPCIKQYCNTSNGLTRPHAHMHAHAQTHVFISVVKSTPGVSFTLLNVEKIAI